MFVCFVFFNSLKEFVSDSEWIQVKDTFRQACDWHHLFLLCVVREWRLELRSVLVGVVKDTLQMSFGKDKGASWCGLLVIQVSYFVFGMIQAMLPSSGPKRMLWKRRQIKGPFKCP